MQSSLVTHEAPQIPHVVHPDAQEAPRAPTAAQTAARWVGRALDPRPSARLLGRAGAALGALALQPRGAAATTPSCWEYKNFKSPNSGDDYAIYTGCGGAKDYLNRFVKACGAVPTSGHNPLFWHTVKNWGIADLYRNHHDAAPNDADFVSCLLTQGKGESKHQGAIAGIVIGSVVGAVVIGCGIFLGIKACCNRSGGGGTRDVEAGAAAPAAVQMQPA